MGIRFFFTELGGGIGGFDNRAHQRENHASLLAQLSAAVTAFCTDLAQADFRRVYATLLDPGLAFDSHPILGRRFEPLALFT